MAGEREGGQTFMSRHPILLLDPFENVLTIYRMVLEEEGYQVDILTDLLKSSQLFSEKKYPIIIMEYFSSLEQTIHFIKEIKKSAPETYIILNTSNVIDDQTYKQLFESGLDDYLLKPYAPEKLMIHIQRGLKQRGLILENQEQGQRSFFEPMAQRVQQEIVNQPYFKKEIRKELKKAKRHQNPMSLLLMNIPSQDKLGERYEPFYGTLVKIIKGSLREEDIVGRENGKLGIILSQTDQTGCQILEERLSKEIQTHPSFQADAVIKTILQDLSFQSYTFPDETEFSEFLERLLEEFK
jgi:DNA-binding response OmpR family regulator